MGNRQGAEVQQREMAAIKASTEANAKAAKANAEFAAESRRLIEESQEVLDQYGNALSKQAAELRKQKKLGEARDAKIQAQAEATAALKAKGEKITQLLETQGEEIAANRKCAEANARPSLTMPS